MLFKVIALNGKAGSGKDTYSNVIKDSMNCNSVYLNKKLTEKDLKINSITEVLGYANSLRRFCGAVTMLPNFFARSSRRDTKDTPLSEKETKAVFNRFKSLTKDGAFRHFETTTLGIPYDDSDPSTIKNIASPFTVTKHFPVRVNVSLAMEILQRDLNKDGSISCRSILKAFGAQSGAVPPNTWIQVMTNHLLQYHKPKTPYVIIISDLRVMDEVKTLRSFCKSRGIYCRVIRIEEWERKENKDTHITEVGLDNNKDIFDLVMRPRKGRGSFISTLKEITRFCGVKVLDRHVFNHDAVKQIPEY